MKNYYKSCKVIRDSVMDNYLRGRRKLKDGTYKALGNQVNKYNKKFLEDINDINFNFYKLVRANTVAQVLIKAYHDDASENKILRNLTRAQSETIRFNRQFKRALSTYEIKYDTILKAIQNDIKSQYDRVNRNLDTLIMLLGDLGFNSLLDAIKKETSMNFVEYLNYLEENSNIEKPDLITDEDKQAYYEALTDYEFQGIHSLIQKHKIKIDTSLSESIKRSRKKKDNIKEEIQINKQIEKDAKVIDKVNNKFTLNCCRLQNDIMANWWDKTSLLNEENASKLYSKLSKQGIGYYISIIRLHKGVLSSVEYFSEKGVTDNVVNIKFFNSVQEAQQFKESHKINNKHKDEKHYTSIQKIVVQNRSSAAIIDAKILEARKKYEKEEKERLEMLQKLCSKHEENLRLAKELRKQRKLQAEIDIANYAKDHPEEARALEEEEYRKEELVGKLNYKYNLGKFKKYLENITDLNQIATAIMRTDEGAVILQLTCIDDSYLYEDIQVVDNDESEYDFLEGKRYYVLANGENDILRITYKTPLEILMDNGYYYGIRKSLPKDIDKYFNVRKVNIQLPLGLSQYSKIRKIYRDVEQKVRDLVIEQLRPKELFEHLAIIVKVDTEGKILGYYTETGEYTLNIAEAKVQTRYEAMENREALLNAEGILGYNTKLLLVIHFYTY